MSSGYMLAHVSPLINFHIVKATNLHASDSCLKQSLALPIAITLMIMANLQFTITIHNALLSTTTYYRYSMKEHDYISQASLLQVK